MNKQYLNGIICLLSGVLLFCAFLIHAHDEFDGPKLADRTTASNGLQNGPLVGMPGLLDNPSPLLNNNSSIASLQMTGINNSSNKGGGITVSNGTDVARQLLDIVKNRQMYMAVGNSTTATGNATTVAEDRNTTVVDNLTMVVDNAAAEADNVITVEGNVPTEADNLTMMVDNVPAEEDNLTTVADNLTVKLANLNVVVGNSSIMHASNVPMETNNTVLDNSPMVMGNLSTATISLMAMGNLTEIVGNLNAVPTQLNSVAGNTSTVPDNLATIKVNSTEVEDTSPIVDFEGSITQLVKHAIAALNAENGSSKGAILTYIMYKFNVGNDKARVFEKVDLAIKEGLLSGELAEVKGLGFSVYYKLADSSNKIPMYNGTETLSTM